MAQTQSSRVLCLVILKAFSVSRRFDPSNQTPIAMTAPRVSVITVAYNSAATITDTLKSVNQQTYPDIEHLVIDGGSSDDTLALVKTHGARVTKLLSEPDCGIYDAMNKGIRLASGDIIGFINSDDFYASPSVLQTVASVFVDPKIQACWGDLCYVKQYNTDQIIRYWQSSSFLPGLFARGWCPPHPTLFVRRQVFERFGMFNLSYRIAADMELMARLIEVHRIQGYYIPQVLVHMRMGGTTNRSLRNIVNQNREIWRALRAHRLAPSLLSFVTRKLISRARQFVRRASA